MIDDEFIAGVFIVGIVFGLAIGYWCGSARGSAQAELRAIEAGVGEYHSETGAFQFVECEGGE